MCSRIIPARNAWCSLSSVVKPLSISDFVVEIRLYGPLVEIATGVIDCEEASSATRPAATTAAAPARTPPQPNARLARAAKRHAELIERR